VSWGFFAFTTQSCPRQSGREIIHTYDVVHGQLTEKASIKLPTKNPDGQAVNMYPAGIAVKEDQIDERTFNEAIWKSGRGKDSVMPAPSA
jgi:hypothetical protein